MGLYRPFQTLSDTCKNTDVLGIPRFKELLRRFLFDHENPDSEQPGDAVSLQDCPHIASSARIHLFNHAISTYYAPSEIHSTNGMHRDLLRCNPRWFHGKGRYDTCLVQIDDGAVGLASMIPARILSCFSFLEWFEYEDDSPDPITGMWIVQPEFNEHNQKACGVIPIDSIVRSVHLVGVCEQITMPRDHDYRDSLDAFSRFYVNWYSDYHAHEVL
ncbi:uncharacterized protein BXZ73DRAFT_56713 [Epithele typhae]|uniref:uncharacterized protein n=1 Tax=Epithele typhae TaxID=378194 RepID=UPI0020084143|nr:uncharacterized protein BXZ73DRAFT_56713 [Epithele typhae]KAH9911917.1 hypothetical protein BXZ73DRAFT_56713 [Epithele typhae]